MMEKNLKNNYLKLIVVTLLIFLATTSASPAIIRTNIVNNYYIKNEDSVPLLSTLDDPLYEWVDNLNNEQLIESSMSYDYVLSEGKAEIKSTWPIWTDTLWTKMVPITLNNKIGSTLYDHAIYLNVDYD